MGWLRASPTSWQMHLANLDFWQNHKIHPPTSWQMDLANCQGWQNQPFPAHICAHSSAWHRCFFGRFLLSRARENLSAFPFFPRSYKETDRASLFHRAGLFLSSLHHPAQDRVLSSTPRRRTWRKEYISDVIARTYLSKRNKKAHTTNKSDV